jgi:hypothetical protein
MIVRVLVGERLIHLFPDSSFFRSIIVKGVGHCRFTSQWSFHVNHMRPHFIEAVACGSSIQDDLLRHHVPIGPEIAPTGKMKVFKCPALNRYLLRWIFFPVISPFLMSLYRLGSESRRANRHWRKFLPLFGAF